MTHRVRSHLPHRALPVRRRNVASRHAGHVEQNPPLQRMESPWGLQDRHRRHPTVKLNSYSIPGEIRDREAYGSCGTDSTSRAEIAAFSMLGIGGGRFRDMSPKCLARLRIRHLSSRDATSKSR
jgi:hypothetical protein